MNKTLLTALAAMLTPSLAPAQLVVSDSFIFGAGNSVYYHDLVSGTPTPALGLYAGGVADLAADDAGGVLYLLDRNTNLHRWPYTDPTPTLVGSLTGTLATGIAFGNGRLYVAGITPCGMNIFEVDPLAPGSPTLILQAMFLSTSIAFDPSTGLLVLCTNTQVLPCSSPAGAIYTMDPLAPSPSLTLLAPYPALSPGGNTTIGGGKLWFADNAAGVFNNLDLATLTWDPSPPVNPITPGLFGTFNCTWSPILAGTSGSVAYCTAGTSANGCNALLSTTGTASATASSGFTLEAAGVEGLKSGLFFFGTNGRQANPWGSGTSSQCVVPPVMRAGLLGASGTVGLCDGTFSQDLNALWCAACPKSLKNPGAGALVQAQLWYRDPLNTSNQTTSLSDAVEFTVEP